MISVILFGSTVYITKMMSRIDHDGTPFPLDRLLNQNTTTYTFSAPGKAILFGEHAVVYGKTALAVAIGQRTRVDLTRTKRSVAETAAVTLNLTDLSASKSWTRDALSLTQPSCGDEGKDGSSTETDAWEEAPLVGSRILNPSRWLAFTRKEQIDSPVSATAQAFLAFHYLYASIQLEYNKKNLSETNEPLLSPGGDDLSLSVNVKSGIPVGAGLGSSASYAVCIATGILHHFGLLIKGINVEDGLVCSFDSSLPARELINFWAFQAERIIHGNPSGVDNRICTFGGGLFYKKNPNDPAQAVIIPCSFPAQFRFLLTHTQVPKNTKSQVEKVAQLHVSMPKVCEAIFNAIEEINSHASCILSDSSAFSVDHVAGLMASWIQMNQGLLEGLGMSHPAIRKVIQMADLYGYRSKLTGAGGGGCVLTFLGTWEEEGDEKVTALMQGLAERGFLPYIVSVGCPGVQMESSLSSKMTA